jgi:hypothetical protein
MKSPSIKPLLKTFRKNRGIKWNSYVVNRYVSMDIRYIELANYIQTIPYDNKHQLYQIYREMIPKIQSVFEISQVKKLKNILLL